MEETRMAGGDGGEQFAIEAGQVLPGQKNASREIRLGMEPPSYEDAIGPPSYELIFGREVKDGEKSAFGKGVSGFTSFSVVLSAVTTAVYVAMIVMGYLYRNECPQQVVIPIYLLVGGSLGLLKELLHMFVIEQKRREGVEGERWRLELMDHFLSCLMVILLLLGSWLYSVEDLNYDQSEEQYCNKTVYLFAFWLITSAYFLLALIVFYLSILAVWSLLRGAAMTRFKD